VADEDKTYTQDEVDEHVAGLKSALEKERTERRQAKQQLGDLQGKYDELSDTVQELKSAAVASDAGISDEKLAELRSTIEADAERKWAKTAEQLDQFKQSDAEKEARIRELTLDNVVKDFIAKGGAHSHRVGDIFRLTADRYELTDDGEPVLKGEARSVPLDKYVKDTLAGEYPEWFEGSGSSGGGASKSSSGGAGGAVRRIAASDIVDNVEGVLDGSVVVEMEG
jgi:hypothetical protein